jgi:pimeloyl-ACP methyl ester carboxylesterase
MLDLATVFRSTSAVAKSIGSNMTVISKLTSKHQRVDARNYALAAAAGAATFGALAIAAWRQSINAEQQHPALGKFVDVQGVHLHYIDRGAGEPLVLIHGNGTQIEDFETSGLIDIAARSHRVLVFDRPGYGYSSRPRSAIWTASAQADLLHEALGLLGLDRYLVLGHSRGASVAMALALRHAASVKGLVLLSGYYYPTDNFGSALQSLQASPIIGDVLRYTLSPLLGRLAWSSLMTTLFSPADVSPAFSDAIREMALRPSQLHASSADIALMIPDAIEMQNRYGLLSMPVSIVVGEDDRLIDVKSQSTRLHGDISGSSLHVISGLGHMVHHGAPNQIMKAIEQVA